MLAKSSACAYGRTPDMPWLLNEDAAVKAKFAGLKVTDANADADGRPVAVRFRLPESEIGEIQYPMVVIDHAGVLKDEEREIRGAGWLPYAPEGQPRWDDYGDVTASPYHFQEFPIPYNIDYNITVYSRKARHDLMLQAELARTNRIPARFGYLEIPQDQTLRRLDLIGGPEPAHTKDGDGKRVFRQVYKIRVSSELLPAAVDEVTRVLNVQADLTYYSDTYDLPLESLI
jgi:hypothetical protein